jgi:RNA polymerase sigma factor (sigma-70 family)
VNDSTDQTLLREYAERHSEAAFSELVRRHVDLVYSAAFRMTSQATAAQDVSQAVFLALAQNAARLADHPVLSGWLHCTARNLAAKTVRAAVRRQHHEQEAVAMNQLLSADTEPPWAHIAPHLDAALGELDDTERDAIMLRYFERKSAPEIAAQVGISAEAAQKRVSRAVERLRALFATRGVTVGAGGLVAVISANAVQAAPAGLAATISTVALAGAVVSHSTIITATTKTIAMTALQKTLITATAAVVVGGGIYQARHTSQLQARVETLQQEQAPLAEQVQQLRQERDEASSRLAEASNRIAELNGQVAPLNSEVVKLRAETVRLRGASKELAALKAGGQMVSTGGGAAPTGDPAQLTQEGWQLLQTGKMAEAIPAFEAATKLDPKNPEAWNGLGWANFRSGKTADAEKAFQQAVELQPDHPAALNGLGQMYLSQKKYAEAEQYFLKAGPKAPAAWYGLTRLYLLQDKFEDAERWAQTIVDSGQGDEGVRAMLKAAKDKKVSDGLRLMIEPQ